MREEQQMTALDRTPRWQRIRGWRRASWTCGLIAISGLGRTVPVAAQQDTVRSPLDTLRRSTLASISVTARQIGTPPPPAAVTVVPGARVRRTLAGGIYDAVRNVAGVEIHDQGQGPGFAPNVVIRGFSSDHGSDVLLSMDGIPINLPAHGHIEGYADWTILPRAATSGFQVIHGPGSPLFGNFALGGVIDWSTARDADGSAGTISASSYGDVTGWGRTGQRSETRGWLASLEGGYLRGWRDNADSWTGTTALRGWRQAGDWQLTGGLTGFGSSWNSPGFVSVERYDAGDLTAAADPTDGGSAGRLIASGEGIRTVEGSTVKLLGWFQATGSASWLGLPEDDVLEQVEEREHRVAAGLQLNHTWTGATGLPEVGASLRGDRTHYGRYNTEERVRLDTEANVEAGYAEAGTFARWRPVIGSRTAFDLGVRLDAVHLAVQDLDTAGPAASVWQTVASPKLGVRFQASQAITLIGSFARGFRNAPGALEDPARPLVTSWAGEVGAQAVAGAFRIRLAAFRYMVDHERIQDPVTLEISDAGSSVRQGLSGDLSANLGHHLLAFADITYNDATISQTTSDPAALMIDANRAGVPDIPAPSFHEVPIQPGDRVPGVAEYWGRAGLEAHAGAAVTFLGAVRFSGPFTPIGEQGVRTGAYAILELGASVPVGRGLTVDVDLQNLLDTRYQEIRASGYLNPGAPRTLRAALRLSTDRNP
jgi:outer membrane receptor protein involved in Fe transport